MPFDNWILLVVLVVVTALWVAIIVVGWRIVRRARTRSRELNDQIVNIHRSLEHVRRNLDDDLRRLGQLAEVERVAAVVHLAAERGTVSRESALRLLTNLHDVQDALLAAAAQPGERSET